MSAQRDPWMPSGPFPTPKGEPVPRLSAEQLDLLERMRGCPTPGDASIRCPHHVKNYRDAERDIWEPAPCPYKPRPDGSCPRVEYHVAAPISPFPDAPARIPPSADPLQLDKDCWLYAWIEPDTRNIPHERGKAYPRAPDAVDGVCIEVARDGYSADYEARETWLNRDNALALRDWLTRWLDGAS